MTIVFLRKNSNVDKKIFSKRSGDLSGYLFFPVSFMSRKSFRILPNSTGDNKICFILFDFFEKPLRQIHLERLSA